MLQHDYLSKWKKPVRSRDRETMVSAAILAGGNSSRFGTAKSEVMLGGKTLVHHIYDAVLPVADEVLLSLGAGTDAARLNLPDAIPVYDQYRDCGPLAGIHACMGMAANPWLLVVACDLPFIETASLERLVGACSPSHQIVYCGVEGGQAQPLCGCYHRSLQDALGAALYEERYAVHRFLDSVLHVRRIDIPGPELVNVNRVEDLPPAGSTSLDDT